MPLSERRLIKQIRRAAGRNRAVITGIGDDCAVLQIPEGHQLLVTTDFSIEGVHFLREWHRPELVGWRCLTRGLSDIAAMGGRPMAAFLSLAIARGVPQPWVKGFMKGILQLAKKYDVSLAGGDTAQSTSGIQADIVVVGSVPKGKAILRSGAKPGDAIYVTGSLGASAAAISRMKSSPQKSSASREKNLFRNLRHTPRLDVGEWLQKRGMATAMIDVSDGLSTDLSHICEESGVGADIVASNIPRGELPSATELVDLNFALHGGEDYELLFTSPRVMPRTIAGVRITPIGVVTRNSGMRIETGGRSRRLRAQGWEHFKNS